MLFPQGFDPNVVNIPAIAAEMRPALYRWFSASIQVLNPNSKASTERYDAKLDSGGKAAGTLLFATTALVQPIGGARSVEQGDQATAIQGIRLQIPIESVPAPIQLRSGLQVLVLSGGNNPDLGARTYVLKKPLDSSLAWGHILEATVVTGGRS